MAADAISPISLRFDEAAGTLSLHFEGSAASAAAFLEPLVLETAQGHITGRWAGLIQTDSSGAQAFGSLEHPHGRLDFTLRAGQPASPLRSPIQLEWQVTFQAPCRGALYQAVWLPGVDADPAALTLPGVYYGHNTYGKGLFPHPDPAHGFAFRADRLPQPAIHYASERAAWDYFTADEAPAMAAPEKVYSLGLTAGESGLRLFFRYPQLEFGHGSRQVSGGPDAYIAKSTFGPGEDEECAWEAGDRVEKTFFLGCTLPPAKASAAAPARFLWACAYPNRPAAPPVDLWQVAGERLRWINTRLYRPDLAGGQYESPEGSGTAMLGFVEQSLSMASTTLRYALADGERPTPALPAETRALWEHRAIDVLNRWTSAGVSPEGLLYPACDRQVYRFGVRDYADDLGLRITHTDVFETQRLTTEVRRLLSAASAVRKSRIPIQGACPDQWERAAVSVGRWLSNHPLPEGGYAARYTRSGDPVEPDPSGTAFAISLFCDLAREDRAWADLAGQAFQARLAELVRKDLFSGGTLDASSPDREAAIAALEACVQLYETTRDSGYLDDARHAVDNLLTYTFVYSIRTFGTDTDAFARQISTFGATLVSPENQHLDPFPLGLSMLKYGQYAQDPVARQAALESLRFCLDGRWAIPEKEGLKQSEQFAHTRWYYNTFFTRRGNFRRGMPIFGLPDSEHGWPQVIPVAVLLDIIPFFPGSP
jgi:hypothetical protein